MHEYVRKHVTLCVYVERDSKYDVYMYVDSSVEMCCPSMRRVSFNIVLGDGGSPCVRVYDTPVRHTLTPT